MTIVVFGIGHPDRGDDAAGWLVAGLLTDRPGRAVRQVTADPTAMLTDPLWDAAEHAVIVDALRGGGAPPGTVRRWELGDLGDLDVSLVRTGAGTHDLGVVTSLELARALGRMPPRVTLIGIEAGSCTPGTPPCAPVLSAVERLAADLDIETALGAAAPDGDPVGA